MNVVTDTIQALRSMRKRQVISPLFLSFASSPALDHISHCSAQGVRRPTLKMCRRARDRSDDCTALLTFCALHPLFSHTCACVHLSAAASAPGHQSGPHRYFSADVSPPACHATHHLPFRPTVSLGLLVICRLQLFTFMAARAFSVDN